MITSIEAMWIVYKISSPNNPKIYFGITSETPNIRLSHHVSEAKLGSQRFFHKWIRDCDFNVRIKKMKEFPEKHRAMKYERYLVRKIGSGKNKKYMLNTYDYID